jgi:putative copper resistance protein D
MNDSFEAWIGILSTALFDWSLALATGSLLAGYWLRRGPAVRVPQIPQTPKIRSAAILMALALGVQFYLMVAMMTGQAGFREVLAAAPSVATTHAGGVALATLGVVVLLLLADLLKPPRTRAVFSVLVALILAFHAATGHAAVAGDFSRAELLQFLHLSGMALWTGGVIVSGLFVVPQLIASGGGADKAYLQSLSRVSTVALAAVLLTGAIRGWTGLDGHLSGLLHTGWGRILLAKLGVVAVALALGWLHRRWIRQPERSWTADRARTLVATLRIEAVCLTLVIALSAWLGSVDPSGM